MVNSIKKFSPLSLDDLDHFKEKISFLILTATPTETNNLHNHMKPLREYGSLVETYSKNHTYYLGVFGCYRVVHVQCEMGSVGSSSSLLTVNEAIDIWKPKAVVMIGIAFGIARDSQQIGDVLISEGIIPYESKKVSEKQSIQRSPIPEAGAVLVNRFKNGVKDWTHSFDGKSFRAIPGYILTGEVLIDNKRYRNSLIKKYPHAKGGEMEGNGLYAAARNNRIEWIIVKGICDFADGLKSENKTENQNIAIQSAISLCLHVFSNNKAFEALNFVPLDDLDDITFNETPKQQTIKNTQYDLVNDVLFLSFRIELLKYYYPRNIDEEIISSWDFYNLWISGESGIGKTTIVLKCLLSNNKKCIFIDLSKYINSKSSDLLNCIYLELLDKLNLDLSDFDINCSIDECIRRIVLLFRNEFHEEEIFIYIDEIPIDGEENFRIFFDNIMALQISYSHEAPNSRLKFVFSSIISPPSASLCQSKIKEKYKYIEISRWANSEIEGLCNIIISNLNISISKKEINQVIFASKGIPRFIKKFFRDYLISHKIGNVNTNYLISSLVEELGSNA